LLRLLRILYVRYELDTVGVDYTRVGPKVSGLTYKSRAKWKMLRRIYSATYGEVNLSVSVCVGIKGDYVE
jgi:hypothetical protein